MLWLFALLIAGAYWALTRVTTARRRREAFRSGARDLDLLFGDDSVAVYEVGPGTLPADVVVASGLDHGYELHSQSRSGWRKQSLVFRKVG